MRTKAFNGEHILTSPYGPRNISGTPSFHDGADFDLVYEPVLATRDSKVKFVAKDGYGGIYACLSHIGLPSGEWTLHHSQVLVKAGDILKAGQQYAVSGNSGLVVPAPTPSSPRNGSHLHISWLTDVNNWNSHTDPLPFITGQTGLVAGSNYELNADVNLRTGSGTAFPSQGVVPAGAVCKLRSNEQRIADGYTWVDVEFSGPNTGWMIVDNLVKTDKPITSMAGPIVTPPPVVPVNWEAMYRDAEAELARLNAEVEKLNAKNVQSLQVTIEGNKMTSVGLQ